MTRPAQQTATVLEGLGQWALMLAGPIIWSVYHLVVYVLGEFGCRAGWFTGRTLAGVALASVIIVGLTVIALGASAYAAFRAYRRWRELWNGADAQWSRVEERESFMALAALLLGLLFSFVILLTGIPALVLRPCTYV